MTGLYDENHENGTNESTGPAWGNPGPIGPSGLAAHPSWAGSPESTLRILAHTQAGISKNDWSKYRSNPVASPELKDENCIYCYGPLVDEGTRNFYEKFFGEPAWSSDSFKRDLAEIESSDVTIRINSPGGQVSELSSVVLAMEEAADSKTFTTINEGMAYSAASIVLAMGDERQLAELSETMIHNAQIVIIGDSNELARQAERMSALDQAAQGLYARQLGMDKDKIASMMDETTYMGAEEASECGFGTIIRKSAASGGANSLESNMFGDIMASDGLLSLSVLDLIDTPTPQPSLQEV